MFRRTFAKLPLIFLLLFLVQNISVSYAIDLPDAISVEHSFPKKEYRRGELGNVSIAVTNNMPVSVKLLNLSLRFDWQHEIAIYPEACYFLEFRPDPRILASGEKILFNVEFYVSNRIPQGQHKYEIASYFKVPYSPIRRFRKEDTITIKGNVSVSENTVNQLLKRTTVMLNETKLSAFESEMAKNLTKEANKAYNSGQDSYEKGEFSEAAHNLDLAIVYAMCAYKAETDYWIQEAGNRINEAGDLIYEVNTTRIPYIVDVAILDEVKKLLELAQKWLDIAKQLADDVQAEEAFKYASLAIAYVELSLICAALYPPPQVRKPSVILTPSEAPAGAEVTAEGKGWAAKETVNFFWPDIAEKLAEVKTDEEGLFTKSFTVPNVLPGVYEMKFSAPSGSVMVKLKVAPPPPVDISALEKAVAALSGDVSGLADDVSSLASDVSGLKSDIAALEEAIAAIPLVPVEWIYITAIMAIIAVIAAIAAVVAVYREKTKT